MSARKGLWTIILFISIIFIVTSIVDVGELVQGYEVRIKNSANIQQQADTRISTKGMPPVEGFIESHQFYLLKNYSDQTLLIDVSNAWIHKNLVDSETIQIFFQANNKELWIPATITKKTEFSKATVYEITNSLQGTYSIIGEENSAPIPKGLTEIQKYGITAALIFSMFMIRFFHLPKSKKRKQSEKLQRLEEYLRKSIIKGEDEKKVRARLISAGWNEKVVDKTLERIRYF